MTETAREKAERIQKVVHLVRSSEFIPIEPTELQWAVIADETPELLMGGGAGSGKSVALLAAALIYAHVPGYSALMIRRTFPDLAQPGGLMHLANDWLYNTSARKANGGKEWIFPSGAQLSFGHMETEQEKARYQGAEHSYVAFDEVTHIEQGAVLYLQSRLRQSTTRHPELAHVPLRMRLGANPGGRHAKWVKERYISDENNNPVYHPERKYIHSTLLDNPHLDQEQYRKNLSTLDPVTRAQLEKGDWSILPTGNMFSAENFIRVPGRMAGGGAYRIRMWDLAGSAKKKSDYCAGLLLAKSKTTGILRVEHIVHEKLEPGPLDRKMRETAELDGKSVWIGLEQEMSGAGRLVSNHFKDLLRGYVVRPQKPTGDKVERAGLASSLVDQNMVELTIAPWNDKFISECVGFPEYAHDDMVDAFAYACHALSRLPVRKSKEDEDHEAPRGERGGGVPTGGGASELPRFLVSRIPDSVGGSRRRLPPGNPMERRFDGGPPWTK